MKLVFGILGTGKKRFVATTFVAGTVAVIASPKFFIPVAEGLTIIIVVAAIHTLLVQIFGERK